MSTVCLVMIVKDESPVIERCLRSVLPVVDGVCIMDTGSSDNTLAIVRRLMDEFMVGGVTGDETWVDFAHNRTSAIARARELPKRIDSNGATPFDYLLMMDADHVWHGRLPPDLTADAYYIEHRYNGSHYGIACLMKASLQWQYKGVVHEYLTAIVPHQIVDLPGPWVEVFHDGARARRGDAITYAEDAKLLRAALDRDPGDARSAFYLAQSLKDAGQLTEAYAAYKARSMMPGWDEETWYARLEMARLAERTGAPPETVQRHYLTAYNARPTRAEPLVDLARWHRLNGEFALAFVFAYQATILRNPDDRLFVDSDVYQWRALDEVAISAFYTPFVELGRLASDWLLKDSKYPPEQAARIEANAKFYE